MGEGPAGLGGGWGLDTRSQLGRAWGRGALRCVWRLLLFPEPVRPRLGDKEAVALPGHSGLADLPFLT